MFEALIDAILFRTAPAEDRLWHRWTVIFPVRTVDGEVTDWFARPWRRRVGQGWEYKPDPDAPKWEDNIW
jgi:hypothetical protein